MARMSYSSIHYDPTVEMFFYNDDYISGKCIAVGNYDCTKDGDLSYISEYNGTKVLSKTSDNTYGFSSLACTNATIDLKLSEI